MGVNRNMPNIGPRISVMNTAGKVLARIGDGFGLEVGQFIAPHGVCVDSHGSIYVGEVAYTNLSHHETPPDDVRSFQKLSRAV